MPDRHTIAYRMNWMSHWAVLFHNWKHLQGGSAKTNQWAILSAKGSSQQEGKRPAWEPKWETGKKHSVTKGIREILHVNCRGLMCLSVINSTADSFDQCMFSWPNRTALSRAIRYTHKSMQNRQVFVIDG